MKLLHFFRRKADLKEEIESHLKMATADRVARGESPLIARREAMREFGNLPLIAEVTRECWGWLTPGAACAGPALRRAATA